MDFKFRTKFLFSAVLLFGFLVFGKSVFAANETQKFNVDSVYDNAGRSEITATLRHSGQKGMFFVDDSLWNSLGSNQEAFYKQIASLGDEFDKTIHPRLTKAFGSEWNPGIDNESRVYILIFKMKDGTGGYFNSADEYPGVVASGPNEKELVYLNSLYLSSSWAKNFLAHEFQHLITFNQKDRLLHLTEDVWLNEARSEYAGTLCGYDATYSGSNLERRVKEFLRNPSDSLVDWSNQTADYGAVNLFMQYFVGHYGEQVLMDSIKMDAIGVGSLDSALAKAGFSDRMVDIFVNWQIANFVNECQIGEGRQFCYLNQNLSYSAMHVGPTLSNFLPVKDGSEISFSDKIMGWSGHWYEVLPRGSGLNLIINFEGENGSDFQVPVLIYNMDGSESVRYLKTGALQKGGDIIFDFGNQVKSIVIIPLSMPGNISAHNFSYAVKATSETSGPIVLPEPSASPSLTPSLSPFPGASPKAVPNYLDGSLIRARGDFKVYVIKGKYKRWIQNSRIFAFYPHFGWQDVIEVEPEEKGWYQTAWLIRADGDYRVYEINGDVSRHWLNISAGQFANSGRNWDMVFVVNAKERDFYKLGNDVR